MPITTVEAIVRILRDVTLTCGRVDCTRALACAEKALYAGSSWDKLCELSSCLDLLPDHTVCTVENGLIAIVECYLRDYFKG